MVKKYFYILLLGTFFISMNSFSQDYKNGTTNKTQEPTIEGLTIYPNPVNTGKIYISSKLNLDKKIEIYDVLGKKVLETYSSNKEVSVASLSSGVYIVKIKEGDASATRKLIIN
jgi:hypothetical protein